jgi:putative sterol carrier protein
LKSFDKSEVAGSKLLLKMALSSIFTSQRDLFKEYDFDNLKDFLMGKNNIDWPFMTSKFEIAKFKSIPRYIDKYNLTQVANNYFKMGSK